MRLILADHCHHPLIDSLCGIPVVVSASVANFADIFVPPGSERACVTSGASIVRLRDGGGVRLLPFSSSGETDQVFSYGAPTVSLIAAAAGPGPAPAPP